jgi:hypothetical protein
MGVMIFDGKMSALPICNMFYLHNPPFNCNFQTYGNWVMHQLIVGMEIGCCSLMQIRTKSNLGLQMMKQNLNPRPLLRMLLP